MSQNRMMLSMKRRKWLWWGRILPLLIMVCTIFIFTAEGLSRSVFGEEFIPNWLGWPSMLIIFGSIMFSPMLILFAHHPFEEIPVIISNAKKTLAKCCWFYMYLVLSSFSLSLIVRYFPVVQGYLQKTVEQIDARIALWFQNITAGWDIIPPTPEPIADTLGVFVMIGFILAYIKYDKLTGWKMLNHWTLKFPPEEYPPINKIEKTQKDTRITIHAL